MSTWTLFGVDAREVLLAPHRARGTFASNAAHHDADLGLWMLAGLRAAAAAVVPNHAFIQALIYGFCLKSLS